MTDPWSDLDGYRAEVTRLAGPIPLAELQRRARRRRGRQIAGVVGAVTLIIGGVGVGYVEAGQPRTAGPAGHTNTPAPPSTGSTSTPPNGPYQRIPPSYPWLSFVADPGGDGSIDGPGRLDLQPLRACGRGAWDSTGVDPQRAVLSHLPDSTQLRQIVLFTNQGAAQVALERARTAFADCPVERHGGGFATRYVVSVPDLVGSSIAPPAARLAVSARETFNGAPALGLTELRWVRIGNAIIFTKDSGEPLSNDPRPSHAADRVSADMVTSWCDLAGGC